MSKIIENGDGTFFYSRKEQVAIKHLNIAKEILIDTEADHSVIAELQQLIDKISTKLKEVG